MVYIFVFLLSIISVMLFMPLTKKTKLPITIYLLVMGILLGQYGLLNVLGEGNILGFDNLQTSLSAVSGIAILLLFLNSGIGLNLSSIKNSGKEVVLLSTIPVHIEGIILSIIAYILLVVLFPGLGYSAIPILAFIPIMLIGAMSSPVLVIPEALTAKAEGKKSKIFDNMIIATIVDAFTPFPLIIISLVLLVSSVSGNSDMSIIVLVLATIIGCILAYIIGHIFGLIYGIVIHKSTVEENTTKTWVLVVLMNVFSVILVLMSGPLKGLGILITVGIGVGINMKLSPEVKTDVLAKSQKLFGMFFFPIVFIYVGTQVQVSKLLDPIMILVLIIITISAPFVKGQVSRFILAKNGYTKQEQTYSDHAFFLKGIVLINMSVLIGPLFSNLGLTSALDFLYLLAAVEVIATVPYGAVRLAKDRINWINE